MTKQKSKPLVKVTGIEENSSKFVSTPFTEKEILARKEQAKNMVRLAGGFPSIRTASFGMGADVSMASAGNFYSPQLSTDFLEKPQNLRERRAWYRHFYNSSEIVGAAIDLHSTLPLSKIRLRKPKANNPHTAEYSYRFFTRMADRLNLLQSLSEISHEFWLFGNCPTASMSATTPSGLVSVKDIKQGDMVLSHDGNFHKVEATCERLPKDLNRINLFGDYKPLELTPDHPVEILRGENFEFVNVKDLKPGDFIRYVRVISEHDVKNINYVNNDIVLETKKGYLKTRIIPRERQKEANRVRTLLLEWLGKLKFPTQRTRGSLVKEFNCNAYTLNNVIYQLDKEIENFHTRKGQKGFGNGSCVEWYPVINYKSFIFNKYNAGYSTEFITKKEIEIDNDFLYLLGYWLGDGTLSRDNSRLNEWGRANFNIVFGEESYKQSNRIRKILFDKLDIKCIKEWVDKINILTIKAKSDPCFVEWWASQFGETSLGLNKKRIPMWVKRLPRDKLIHLLAGIVDSDGCFPKTKNNRMILSLVSKSLLDDFCEVSRQIGFISYKSEGKIFNKSIIRGKKINSKPTKYILTIYDNDYLSELEMVTCKKFTVKQDISNKCNNRNAIRVNGQIAYKIKSIEDIPVEPVYSIQVADTHTYVINGYSTHNCILYTEDFDPYAGYTTEVKESLKAKGKSQSDMLLSKYQVPDKDPNDIGWRKLTVLPPDQVRITKKPFADNPIIEYLPDSETRSLLNAENSTMGQINFDDLNDEYTKTRIPTEMASSLSTGGTVVLQQDPSQGSFAHHFARKKSQYETMGVSILERCINTLLVKDKLRQAQTSIASRHMTPTRVVWGDQLNTEQVEDLRMQIDMALMDPDYSIIANYEVHWDEYGSNQRLLELSTEFDRYDSDLCAGLGVTKEILTGESTYTGSKISLEILNIQYLQYRDMLQEFVEKMLFEPVAIRKGFVETDEYGLQVAVYPKLSFTRMSLKDNDSLFEQVMQLYNKGSIPIDDVYDIIGFDGDASSAKLKDDLFTVRDSSFNDLLRGAYQSVAQDLVTKTNLTQKAASSLGLAIEEPPTEGDAGAGGGMGGLRFASDEGKSVAAAINMIMKNPELAKLFVKFAGGKNAAK